MWFPCTISARLSWYCLMWVMYHLYPSLLVWSNVVWIASVSSCSSVVSDWACSISLCRCCFCLTEGECTIIVQLNIRVFFFSLKNGEEKDTRHPHIDALSVCSIYKPNSPCTQANEITDVCSLSVWRSSRHWSQLWDIFFFFQARGRMPPRSRASLGSRSRKTDTKL